MTTTTQAVNTPISRRVSFWVLLAIIGIFGVMFYRLMATFFLPVFLAALLVVMFQPLYDWLLQKCGDRKHIAGTLATISVVLIVFVPTGLVFTIATNEAISMGKRFDATKITGKLDELREKYGLELPLKDNINVVDKSLEKLQAMVLTAPPTMTTEPNAANMDSASVDPSSAAIAKPSSFQEADAKHQAKRFKEEIERFREHLVDLPEAELQAKGPDLRNSLGEMIEALENEESYISPERFEFMLQDVAAHWSDFKATLLGGPLTARLKELANPTADDLLQWRNQLLHEVQVYLLPVTKEAFGLIAKLLFGTIIMLVTVFFFFTDGPRMTAAIMRLIPMDVRHQHELVEEFGNISRAVVIATLLSAIVQGVLAGLGFWVAGIQSVAFLVLVTSVLAMVPFVGAVAVWVPVCLWLLIMEGETRTALLLAIYCAVIVSQSDNVVKPMILQGKSKLHPLLALLSILGGVQALGPIGILVGPMVVVFLQTLLNILHRELSSEAYVNATAHREAINEIKTEIKNDIVAEQQTIRNEASQKAIEQANDKSAKNDKRGKRK